MKQFLIFAIAAIMIFTSCKKDATINSTTDSPRALSAAVSASSNGDIIVTDDLTGLQVDNLCTGEKLTAIQGSAIFNVAPDGNLRSLNFHNFVLTDNYGNVYHGIYVLTFISIGSDGLNNTYKMILNPIGGDKNMILQGEFHLLPTGSGGFNAVIDKFFIKCP